jgi:hypothetical protein
MRQKSIEVQPYANTFRVFNKIEHKVYEEYDDVLLASGDIANKVNVNRYDYQQVSFTLKLEPDFSYVIYGPYMGYNNKRKNDVGYLKASPWVILTDLGDIVTKDELETARRARHYFRGHDYGSIWKRREESRKRLLRVKNSPLRIKETFGTVHSIDSRGEDSYDNPLRYYYRRPKTYQERKAAIAHSDEYGNEIVRGARKKTSLPTGWDDLPISTWKTERSWKHNSKRRKQWIPK